MALYHSVRGSVNYTIVGTPIIVDGIASGFSSSNYLSLTSSYSPLSDTNTLESGVKFITGNTVEQMSITGNSANQSMTGFRITSAGKLQARLRVAGSSSLDDTNLTAECDYVLQANTTYSAKFTVSNHSFNLYLYASDNTLLSTGTTPIDDSYTSYYGFTSAYKIGYAQQGAFNGSIDLNNTYIKIDGQAWFGLCPVEVQKHQLMGPVGYTIYGDGPAVTDGWLSGLNSSSSCKTTQTLPAFQTLELMVNVRYPNVTSSSFTPVLSFTDSAPSHNKIWANASGGHGINAGSSTGIVTIDNNTFNYVTASSQPNGYFIKMTVVKNASDYTYTLSLSLDGQTWTSASANYATNICTDYVSFLRTASGSASGRPQMNMNTSYIKVNGKLWFWQPQPTKKIYVNNVLVWEKSA